MNFRKTVAVIVIAVITSSCAGKTGQEQVIAINTMPEVVEEDKIEISANEEKNEKTESVAAADIAGGGEVAAVAEESDFILDEDALPLPDLDIYASFSTEEAGEGGEYYEEFKEFNVPMAMTSRVSAYIKYFTEKVPNTTQTWLDRSNKYMYIVRDIFIKEGLPTDLAALAFTESGFNTQAVSHAGAAGMWQFIPSTGKLYGMESNFWIDERRDFEKASSAAAKYLKALYARFGDWYLALAAYNAGPGKIARATKKHATKDFFKISRNRYTLKLETRDYVPKFLAQLIIYKNYLKYNFTPPSEMPLLYDTVTVPDQTNLYWLSGKLGIESAVLRELNPALKLPMTPPGEYVIRVPYGLEETAAALVKDATPEERAMYKIYHATQGEKIAAIAKKTGSEAVIIKKVNGLKYDTVFASRPLFIPIEGITDSSVDEEFSNFLIDLAPKYYRVKRGDTFIQIAHKHNMRLTDLQRLNPNVRASRIYPGQQLVVSEGATSARRTVATPRRTVKKTTTTTAAARQSGKYKVRYGDSLWSIAKKFGTTVDALMTANNLSDYAIQPGKILSIRK